MFTTLSSSNRLERKSTTWLSMMTSMEYERFKIIKIGEYFVFCDEYQIFHIKDTLVSGRLVSAIFGKKSNYMNQYLRAVWGTYSKDYYIKNMQLVHDTKWNHGGFVPLFSVDNGTIDVLTYNSNYEILKNGRLKVSGQFHSLKPVDQGRSVGLIKNTFGKIFIYDPKQNRFANITPSSLHYTNITNFDFCKEKHCLAIHMDDQLSLWDIRYDRHPYFTAPCKYMEGIHNAWVSVYTHGKIALYSCVDPAKNILLNIDSTLTSDLIWDESDLHIFTFPTVSYVTAVEHVKYSVI